MQLMESNYREPLNLGQDRLISINDLADLVTREAGITLRKRHVPGPQGVRGRNSDNQRIRDVLHWEPKISLEQGIALHVSLDRSAGRPLARIRRGESCRVTRWSNGCRVWTSSASTSAPSTWNRRSTSSTTG